MYILIFILFIVCLWLFYNHSRVLKKKKIIKINTSAAKIEVPLVALRITSPYSYWRDLQDVKNPNFIIERTWISFSTVSGLEHKECDTINLIDINNFFWVHGFRVHINEWYDLQVYMASDCQLKTVLKIFKERNMPISGAVQKFLSK